MAACKIPELLAFRLGWLFAQYALETARPTRAALENLKQNQQNLTRALEKIDGLRESAVKRPDGVTLH